MDRRIPSLDGARTASILLVIFAHLSDGQHDLPLIWRIDYGNLGVRTFFVISGFLITSLLLQELRQTGSISLPDFYLRRLFRIAPAYYVYIGVVTLLIPIGLIVRATYNDLPPALFYYTNYRKTVGSLGMTWSLSVEEQFYVLWPTAIVLLGLIRARYCCLALLIIAPAFRVLCDLHLWPTYSKFAFECVSDALATGCLLALFRERIWNVSGYRRLMELGLAPLPLVAALLLMASQPAPILRDIIGIPGLNIGLAVLLDRCMRMPSVGFARVLNLRQVCWVGTISYSLYLWQQMFAFSHYLWAGDKLLCIFALAILSHYLVERPFLALGRRFRRTTPATGLATA